jgi:hypothetical protein
MFAKPNLFFIDLEQTIIESWQAPDLINVQRIRSFLEQNNADEVRIFSFAIWNEIDKHRFNDDIKPRIEDALGLPVMSWPSVQDMMRADFDHTGDRWEKGHEVSEFIQLRGKEHAFFNFVCNQYNFTRAVLIDDVVPDMTRSHRIKGWSVEFWNVDSL